MNNPTDDYEIFQINPDGSRVQQPTFNEVDDTDTTLYSGSKKVTYESYGIQISDPDGDDEIYRMNALDGSN